MNLPSRRRLVASVAAGLLLLMGGCASPLWQYDRYVVEGELLGSTCRATIDGRPFVGEVAGLGEKMQFSEDASPPRGQTITSLVCRGIVLQFVSRRGTQPGPGRYRVVSSVIGIDTGSVELYIGFSGINEGHWPFALTGVHLEGKDGYVQLDAMTDSSAHGTFRAIARRQPNGE